MKHPLIAYLGVPAALLAGLTLVSQAWPVIGYETPQGHSRDMAEVRQAISDTAAIAVGVEERMAQDVAEFRDEWKCDEITEELDEALELLRNDRTPALEERVRRLREQWDETKCERFED